MYICRGCHKSLVAEWEEVTGHDTEKYGNGKSK